ncbi:MAG: hypothetical protein M1817_005037 [Caeruleum heppii]|nr:MAG: hypothetical protein M1817_005037 [Caeruleum heppii]
MVSPMLPDLPSSGFGLATPKSTQPSRFAGKVRTRDEAEMDLDVIEPPSSPGKRLKVAFDPEVQVQVISGWEKGIELVREEVRRAIARHTTGDSLAFDRLKEIFTKKVDEADAPSPSTMSNYIIALMGNVSRLNKACNGLVHVVLETDWLERDGQFVAIYVKFLGNLVSAQGSYVRTVLNMLLRNLVFASASSHSKTSESRPLQRYARAHVAIKYLLRLIPSASNTLASLLPSIFPDSTATKSEHADFVRNLLRLVGYAPELKSDVLAIITERLVKIDVQVQNDLEYFEDEESEDLVTAAVRSKSEAVLGLEGDDADSDTESISSDESVDEETRRLQEVKANVQKMDIIMELLFEYYAPSFETPTSIECHDDFDLLLNHFSRIILPTYRSRHTQFLLFHFAQTSPLLIDAFAGTCIHLAFDHGRSAIAKQSAAAYLASFVARGSRVPGQVVHDVFDLIGAQLDSVRRDQEQLCRGPDLRRYGTFYAMVQALLYIFCFRWRDLLLDAEDYLEDEDPTSFDGRDLTWAPGVKDILTRTIYSKLNPLKICSPSIVNEFARIAHHLRFIYIFPLLETNKRLRLSASSTSITSQARSTTAASSAYSIPERETALSARKDEAHQQLDAYFPFDPYQLPVSKRWIEGDYVEWRGIPGLDQAEKDSSEDDSEGEEEGLDDGMDAAEDIETDVDSD